MYKHGRNKSIIVNVVRTEVLATVFWLIFVLLREYQMKTEDIRIFRMKKVSRIFTGIFLYILMLMKATRNRIQIIVKTIPERASC